MDETVASEASHSKRTRTAKVRRNAAHATKEDSAAKQAERLGQAFGDSGRRYSRESAKYLRGLTMAYLEGYRLLSESLGSMASEIARRQEREDDKRGSLQDLLWGLPKHATAGYSKAIEESIGIPRKMVDKFYESYSPSSR
jgi:hypothetical protein